jgi:hypothetical protein
MGSAPTHELTANALNISNNMKCVLEVDLANPDNI